MKNNKKIVIVILIIFLITGFFNNYNNYNNYNKEHGFFCAGCGADLGSMYAEKMLSDYNKIEVNLFQLEASNILYLELAPKYNFKGNHNDPHTGEKCTKNTNDCTSTSLAVSDYYKDTEFPKISNTNKMDYLPPLKYTGSSLVPSFKLTYKGETIADNTYCVYYTKADEYGNNETDKRSYGYNNENFIPQEPGIYFLNILYNPDPSVSPFLGRTSARFEIKKPKTLNPVVKLSKTSFNYDGNVKVPTIEEVSLNIGSTNLILNSDDYSVSYSNINSKEPGNYCITVTIKDYKYHYVSFQFEGEPIYDDDWYSGTTSAQYSIIDINATPTPDKGEVDTETLINAIKDSANISSINKSILIAKINANKSKEGTISYEVVLGWAETEELKSELTNIINDIRGTTPSPSPSVTPVTSPNPSPTPSSGKVSPTPTKAPSSEKTTESNNKEDAVESVLTKAQAQKVKVKGLKITRPKKKQLKIKWNKVNGIKKYQLQISTSKKFKKAYTKTYKVSKTTCLKKNLKSKKKYYVRVRSVASVNGKAVYGKWSAVKSIKAK